MSLEEERMKAKFRPILREIKALERKIDKKEGLIFVNHKYTVEELLDSEHHRKIHSYADKIGDDITRWFNEGKLSDTEEEMYHLKRSEVEDELEDINDQIENREPTWWEEIKDIMVEYVVIIMDKMPDELKRTLLSNLKGAIKMLGNIFSPQAKLPKLEK